MSKQSGAGLTELLADVAKDAPGAWDRLYDLIERELRSMAEGMLRHERPGHSLQATMLVHDVLIRLVGPGKQTWESRRHFFGAATRAMENLLIDYARMRKARKRSPPGLRVLLDHIVGPLDKHRIDMEEFTRALDELAAQSPRKAEVYRLRCYYEMRHEQIAKTLGVSTRTVEKEWRDARLLLAMRLRKQ